MDSFVILVFKKKMQRSYCAPFRIADSTVQGKLQLCFCCWAFAACCSAKRNPALWVVLRYFWAHIFMHFFSVSSNSLLWKFFKIIWLRALHYREFRNTTWIFAYPSPSHHNALIKACFHQIIIHSEWGISVSALRWPHRQRLPQRLPHLLCLQVLHELLLLVGRYIWKSVHRVKWNEMHEDEGLLLIKWTEQHFSVCVWCVCVVLYVRVFQTSQIVITIKSLSKTKINRFGRFGFLCFRISWSPWGRQSSMT